MANHGVHNKVILFTVRALETQVGTAKVDLKADLD